MKILIAYYSRTNFTKKVAENMVKSLDADLMEIVDLKNRQGPLGFIMGGKDAASKRLTKIKRAPRKIDNYDLVIIGTPVWVGTMTPAIRTFLTEEKDVIRRLACFATQGDKKRQRVFDEVNKIINHDSAANTFFVTRKVAREDYHAKLDEFVARIKVIT